MTTQNIYPSYSGLKLKELIKLIRWVYTQANLSFLSILLNIIFLYLFISIIPSKAVALESGGKTSIRANLPAKITLRLFGYTSPNSLVQLLGIRVNSQTTADKNGYFLLEDVPISSEAKEICLSSIDTEGRVTFPTCLIIPEAQTVAEIGPILLSPSLSLSKGTILQNEQVFASGQTIPQQQVSVSLFEVTNKVKTYNYWQQMLVKLFFPFAFADSLPAYTLISNQQGVFSFNLPSAKASDYRLFVKTIYNDTPTPKSQTLIFKIEPIISYFIRLIPLILLIILLLVILALSIYYEKKSKVISDFLVRFNEKRLKPIAVRLRLKFRRLWYNYRDWMKLYRK